MDPIRKKFDSSHSFPFSFVFKDTKSSQSELPDHLHDWYELVYVYSGKGTFFIDQTFYDMRQGDVFAIPGNTIHRAFPDREDPITSTALFFSPILVQQASYGDSFSFLQCFDQSKKLKNYKFNSSSTQQHQLEAYMEQLHEEAQAQKLGHRHAIVLGLEQILLYLSREVDPRSQQELGGAKFGPIWMAEILLYIDEHLDGDVGLHALSLRASVTPAHFCRVFKQLTGMNVTEYITTKRIIKAKELLFDQDHTISLIAEMCGFESLPHFHRMFKRIVGMTPAAYKKTKRPPD